MLAAFSVSLVCSWLGVPMLAVILLFALRALEWESAVATGAPTWAASLRGLPRPAAAGLILGALRVDATAAATAAVIAALVLSASPAAFRRPVGVFLIGPAQLWIDDNWLAALGAAITIVAVPAVIDGVNAWRHGA